MLGYTGLNRLKCSQLEESFKYLGQNVIHNEKVPSAKGSTLVSQYVDTSDGLAVRRNYKFLREDGGSSLVYQPATVGINEEMGVPCLANLIDHYQQKCKNLGVDTIIIPIAEVVGTTIGESRHFVTLQLKVNPETGDITSAYTIDSKGKGRANTREDDIKKILTQSVDYEGFKYHDRVYLNLQWATDMHTCGYFTHNVIKALIENPKASLAGRVVIQQEDSVAMAKGVLKANLGTIQQGACPQHSSDLIPMDYNSPILDEKEASDLLVLEPHDNRSPILSSRRLHKSSSDVELLESSIVFPDQSTLADASLIEIGEKPKQLNAHPVCKAEYHHPFLAKNADWLIQQGNMILQKIYHSDDTVGSHLATGSLIEKLGADFAKLSGIMDQENYTKLEHHGSIVSSINPMGWLKSANRQFRAKNPHADARRNYMMGILCVMWSLYNQAAMKEQDFKRGSFKIIDPGQKLFKFLKGYAQFATGHEDVGILFGANDFAYNRDPNYKLSSHYKGKLFNSEQYGIDFRLWGGHPNLEVLPYKMSHLLFGQVDIRGQKYTILKWEPIGLGNAIEFIEHGTHFAASGHVEAATRREKDIPAPIQKAFDTFLEVHAKLGNGEDFSNIKTVEQMYGIIREYVLKDDRYQGASKLMDAALAECKMLEFVEARTGEEVILKVKGQNSNNSKF